MVDVDGLAGVPTAADFVFRVGNNSDPGTWSVAPSPQSITVRPGAGVDGSDRITLIWADDDPYTPQREPGSISNQWLQVTVRATANMGLAEDDVFYVGNAIGESGNSTVDTNVDTNDEIGARNHPHSVFHPAPIDDAFDYDRDMRVDTNDEILARNNSTSAFTRLQLISVPENGLVPDPNLAQVLREVLERSPGELLAPEQLADPSLKSVDAHDRDITDLSGIQYSTNLTRLDLGENQAISIQPSSAHVAETAGSAAESDSVIESVFEHPVIIVPPVMEVRDPAVGAGRRIHGARADRPALVTVYGPSPIARERPRRVAEAEQALPSTARAAQLARVVAADEEAIELDELFSDLAFDVAQVPTHERLIDALIPRIAETLMVQEQVDRYLRSL